MNSYIVHARRDGQFWFIAIDGLGGATQARSVEEIDAMARDFIGIATGESAEAIELETYIHVPDDAQHHLDEADELLAGAQIAQARAAEEIRAAARSLFEAGIEVTDISRLLDVTEEVAAEMARS